MKVSISKALLRSGILGWVVLTLVYCASRSPEVRPEPETKVAVPEAPRISLKPYHRSMKDEMVKSFETADEIVIGIYTGTYTDGQEGRVYYFDQCRIINKDTWSWSSEMSALLPVLFQEVKFELISGPEFRSLSALDKTGICWDDYEGPRVVFLVEGIPTLLFLRQSFDEGTDTSRRFLIDTYPMTKECRAKDIFDLMLRERAGMSDQAKGFFEMREGFYEPFSGFDWDFRIVVSGGDNFIGCFF